MAEAQLHPSKSPSTQLLLNDLHLSPVSPAPTNEPKRKRKEKSRAEQPRKRVRFTQTQPPPAEPDLLSELIANTLLTQSLSTPPPPAKDPTPTPIPVVTPSPDLLDIPDIVALHYAGYFAPRLLPLADSALRTSLHVSMIISLTKATLGPNLRTVPAVYAALEHASRLLEPNILNT